MVEQHIIALPYKTWFTLIDMPQLTAKVRLQRAGHILGSVYVEIDLHFPETGEKKRTVFSGDLGAPNAPLLSAPKQPYRADILVIESTDHLREDRRTRRQRLERVIEQALANNGTVLIPAFSIGRTQELLYELEEIIHSKKLNAKGWGGRDEGAGNSQDNVEPEIDWLIPLIILDSPLVIRFTQEYREFKPFWGSEALQRIKQGLNPLGFEQLFTVDSHQPHLSMVRHLASTARPAIVIAGNGMCRSGRIVNYLKAMLHDPRHDVLFIGYQAQGTPGRAIQAYGARGGYVDLDGKRYKVGAKVSTIGGYSAHADQKGLLGFVTRMRIWPSQVRIVHGETGAKRELGEHLKTLCKQARRSIELLIPSCTPQLDCGVKALWCWQQLRG